MRRVAQPGPASSGYVLGSSLDNSSYANLDQVKTVHAVIDIGLIFELEEFQGTQTLVIEAIQPTGTVVVDMQGLEIQRINLGNNRLDPRVLPYEIVNDWPDLGSGIVIYLYERLLPGERVNITIEYKTTSESLALNWLTPEQTKSKKYPYVYTQCESIFCRGVAPFQDSPARKFTWDFHMTMKEKYAFYPSGTFVRQIVINGTGPEDAFVERDFTQTIKVPSYLFAFAIGDLEEKFLDKENKTAVITEPAEMPAAFKELTELPYYLGNATEYLGPYIWGKYKLLVLPPSFPYGGMENPLLTFASPTIIVGDKSQVYVATHEICHSWSGNSVTCQNWENLWLNEGFTVFEERHVSGMIYGKEFATVEAYLGRFDLMADMEKFGLTSNYTSLAPNVGRVTPDDSFSEVPYERGFTFLYYIQTLIGEENMKKFLNEYFVIYRQQSVNADMMKYTFVQWVKTNIANADTILSKIDWEAWINKPGKMPVNYDFNSTNQTEAVKLAAQYITGAGKTTPTNSTQYKDWVANVKVIFVNHFLQNSKTVTVAILDLLDKNYNLTSTKNPEVLQRWYPLCIKVGYTANNMTAKAKEWISSQGRMKYIMPVYQALQDNGQHALAVTWFNDNKNFYHKIAISRLKKLLGITVTPQEQAYAEKIEAAQRRSFLQHGITPSF